VSRAAPDGDTSALVGELRTWVAEQLGAIARPDDVRFADNLPKTRSGKIMRRLLRAIARGEQIAQDVSTLENPGILDQLRGVEAPPGGAAAKPAATRKTAAKGVAARKSATNRTAAKQSAPKKSSAKKPAAGKLPAKKPAAKKSASNKFARSARKGAKAAARTRRSKAAAKRGATSSARRKPAARRKSAGRR
jgi:hypothetical protein